MMKNDVFADRALAVPLPQAALTIGRAQDHREGPGREMIFCTLFNWLYLPQGVALYHSIARTVNGGEFTLHVLCMDDFTFNALSALGLPRLRPIPLKEVETDALRAVRGKRSIGEYCWTCTTPLLKHVIAGQPPDAVVIYVDADLRFFSDPSVVLAEMGSGSIYVHEHDFAPEHAELQMVSGRFNVGLVCFRNNAEGRACLDKWSAQCLDECVMDPAAGLCGDQGYLDEWPDLYPGLVIARNPGVGLAPWNISKFRLASDRDVVTVDGRPVVFYHYHSLRMLRPRLGVKPVVVAVGNYRFDSETTSTIYQPYAREVWRASRELDRRKFSITSALPTIPRFYENLRNDQLLFQIAGCPVATERNAGLMKAVYGIDADRDSL